VNDAFVSYARKDRAIAERLVLALEAGGLAVWWDGLLIGGDDFGRTIDAELKRSKCIVVLWSENSIASEWVPNEARRGRNHKARLVPVRIDACEEPLEFSGLHIISLEGWSGDEGHPGLTELLNAVHGISTAPPPPRPPVVKAWHALLSAAALALAYGLIPRPPAVPDTGSGGGGSTPKLAAGGEIGTSSGGAAPASGGAAGASGGSRASGGTAGAPKIPLLRCCHKSLGGTKECPKKTCAECGLVDCE
jgi:hypothetical protein